MVTYCNKKFFPYKKVSRKLEKKEANRTLQHFWSIFGPRITCSNEVDMNVVIDIFTRDFISNYLATVIPKYDVFAQKIVVKKLNKGQYSSPKFRDIQNMLVQNENNC